MTVRGSFFRLSHQARCGPGLRGAKPSKAKRSAPMPEIARAVRGALAPGKQVTGIPSATARDRSRILLCEPARGAPSAEAGHARAWSPGRSRQGHYPVAGVGYGGHSRIGNNQHGKTLLEKVDELRGAVTLIVVVVGKNLPCDGDTQIPCQLMGAASVFCRHKIARREAWP